MRRLCSICLFASLFMTSLKAADLHGTVRDAGKSSVKDAIVSLQAKSGGPPLTTHTNAEGKYRFEHLSKGDYIVSAAKNGSVAAPYSLALKEHETEQFDLTVAPATPAFYDEPKFVVAGVTAGSYQGGHGSDVVLRSTDALAKAAASLVRDRAPVSPELASSLRDAVGKDPNNAELHHALADADEAADNYLEAVREYQRAAELNPSERNLFDWAEELLAHRADDPAAEVFEKGARLYPDSVRTLLGLGAAYYSRGSYDRAADTFFRASDIRPDDPAPYAFLELVQSSVITKSPGFLKRMKRYVDLQPGNAQANYLYGSALWGQQRNKEAATLLEKAVRLDPKLAAAYLMLGIVHFDSKDIPNAIVNFERAIEENPDLEEAHYRLALAYRRTGDSERADKELNLYRELSKKSADDTQRRRNQLQRFVFNLRQ